MATINCGTRQNARISTLSANAQQVERRKLGASVRKARLHSSTDGQLLLQAHYSATQRHLAATAAGSLPLSAAMYAWSVYECVRECVRATFARAIPRVYKCVCVCGCGWRTVGKVFA